MNICPECGDNIEPGSKRCAVCLKARERDRDMIYEMLLRKIMREKGHAATSDYAQGARYGAEYVIKCFEVFAKGAKHEES